MKKHEAIGDGAGQARSAWGELEKLGKEGLGAEKMAGEIAAEGLEEKEAAAGESGVAEEAGEVRQEKVAQAAARVREVYRRGEAGQDAEVEELVGQDVEAEDLAGQEEIVPVRDVLAKRRKGSLAERYAAGERERVERLKEGLDLFTEVEYEWKAIKEEPKPLTKAMRMFADRLGIKTKRGEERREREAMQVALTEYRAEEAAKRREIEEQLAQEETRRLQREAEYKAEMERQEREAVARGMANAREVFDYNKRDMFKKQRVQEIVERDLNSRLLKIDDLETEVLAENPEVGKRTVTFEETEIPVYDLKGLPFSMLSTTIDYRNANKPGEIGTETYRTVMENPAVWAERRDEAEKASGFGTRNGDARGDTISTSYYNSERNMASRVPGDLIYGFEKVEADSVITIANGDGATSNMAGKAQTMLMNPDALKTLEGASGTSSYNEILLRRYSENGMPKRPDYIIVENGRITEAAMRHAKFFNVPIVNIERAVYVEKAAKRGEELLESISEDDDYAELDAKLAELLSMTRYKQNYRVLEGIGRKYDIPYLTMGATRLQEKCLEVSKMEQLKRLEFIAEVLEKATAEIKAATERGELAKGELGQFDFFEVNIQDVQNGKRCITHYDADDRSYDAPGNSNWIDVRFRIRGSSRLVETKVYDGERIYKAEEALAMGVRKQEDIDEADSSYYEKLEPIVREYFEAVRENERVGK